MRRDIGQSRPDGRSFSLDQQSRIHLLAFGRQVAFILLCGGAALFFDAHRPLFALSLMRAMFGFSALFVFFVAALARQPLRRTSMCIWDHFAGMVLLALLSSVAVQRLQ